jgi:SpoVK/Ycf46/Vps4 family AAA+-type ATPase
MNIFFSNILHENNGFSNVELSKRIYVFEDIDADGNITHKRDSEPSKEDIPKHKMSKDVLEYLKEEKTKGVTLAGILNVLDGPMELNGCIVIMTTNHREKLDPALIRSGRIMLDLKLENLEHKYAQQIVDKYYPGKVLSPLKKNINPAELVDLCRQSTSFENLFDLLTEKDYI